VSVRPDGKISFPLLNDIQAAGLTPMQLQRSISDQLRQYMAAPEVSVVVQEIRSFSASVLGEVKKPGRYQLTGEETVLDVLAQAGGLTEFANESGIVVLRSNGSGMEHIPFNYDAAISRKGGQLLFYLRPGDVVVVP
jgi:polysaccharide export outer membrane protein